MVSIAVKGEPVNICTDTLHDGDELRVSYGQPDVGKRNVSKASP